MVQTQNTGLLDSQAAEKKKQSAPIKIETVAVLGAGVMGATIAGHLANNGINTYLLDIVPRDLTDKEKELGLTHASKAVRNRLAQTGKERLFKEKPSPLYTKEVADRIKVGNFDDDLQLLKNVDWIIEVVVENLKIKQQLFARIEQVWQSGTIVSSNTSGISVAKMVEDRSDEFKQHFMGTHFFNPPRYMKLLEIIPTSDTDINTIQRLKSFSENVLGKGVVFCKDTPNFIANRIGTYGLQVSLQVMEEMGLGPDEVDDITGRAMGRPKSATFRTLDLVGLDTFVHVANNVRESVTDQEEQAAFAISPILQKLIDNKWYGEKSGQGFYKKVKTDKGKEILAFDYQTMEYRPRKKLKARSLDQTKRAQNINDKMQALMYAEDVAGKFAWSVTKKVLIYTANRVSEIADDIASVDQAMKWGFNWDLGPFELWDAIGVERSVERMKEEGESIPQFVNDLLASGAKSFYQKEAGKVELFGLNLKFKKVEENKKIISLDHLKEQGKTIKSNSGASLVDIGDGVACLEFHSPKQAIGADIIQMINFAVKEVSTNYEAMVIGNQANNFCVGANIMLMLMEAQDQNWPELDMMIKQFQMTMNSLRYVDKPVVAAPFNMCLGGGVEVCLPCDRIQASQETYMGLVEVGVGLIPGGGGNKEMLIRWMEGVDPKDKVALQPMVNHVFMAIGQAKYSTSGLEAREYKFLRPCDGMTAHADHLIFDAKQVALGLARSGYRPPQPVKIPVVGETGYATLKLGAYGMLKSGYISEHDYKIGCKLAYVLSGGEVAEGTVVSEQYLLDIEREAFLSLIGEPKTQERMQYMLVKGKPLRN